MKARKADTKILVFCPHWGNTLPFEQFCKNVKKAGYDGVEMDLPFEKKKKQELLKILSHHGLLLIAQYWQSLEPSFRDNRASYRRHLENLAEVKPYCINTQTGKDYFSLSQNLMLVKDAAAISNASGVPVYHETHRGKFLFNLPVFQEAIRQYPQLGITLDASHWCNVHESMLSDQKAAMKRAIMATKHIHARIGHEEGPQVNDPRSPEWKLHLEQHFKWWDEVVVRHKGQSITFTTEFGPAPYMPASPGTLRPLASQWQVNLFMLLQIRQRYDF